MAKLKMPCIHTTHPFVQDVTVEPVKAKKKKKPKAKTDVRPDNEPAQKVPDAAALAREEALRKVEEEQQALRAARAKQRELEEELLEKRKQVRVGASLAHIQTMPV